MEMGEKIQKLRLEKEMTLEQLGDQVGVGKSTVRKWENGMIANMRRDKIAKIAEALCVSPGYLMGWEDSPDGTAAAGASPAPESSEDAIVVSDPDEKELIHAYRASPPVIRNAARRVLGLKEDGSSSSGEDGEFFARNNTA